MAPTEGRVARPERRWGCRHSTPIQQQNLYTLSSWEQIITMQTMNTTGSNNNYGCRHSTNWSINAINNAL